MKGQKITKAREIDLIADEYVKKFNSPNSRQYFCKCGWKMSRAQIEDAYEKSQAKGVENPLKLFIFLCEKIMAK